MEKADKEQQATIDPAAVQAALEKLNRHLEPEARFMSVAPTKAPAYNVQTAVDAEHALIVAHAITLDAGDNRQLEPMAQAAWQALDVDGFHVVADAGYSNGEQAARCEQAGLLPHVPITRVSTIKAMAVSSDVNSFVISKTRIRISARRTRRCGVNRSLERIRRSHLYGRRGRL